MRNIIMGTLAAALATAAVAPAFAASNVPNCNSLPRSQYAKCVIDMSKERSSQ